MSALAARRRVQALAGDGPRARFGAARGRRPQALMVRAAGLRARIGGAGRDEVDHAELLERVARSLRSGAALPVALGEASAGLATRPAAGLASAARAARAGTSVVSALDGWVAAEPRPARRLAGAALALGAEVGGGSARSLDAAAASLRDRADLAREVHTLSTQARSSAFVMVTTPVAFTIYTSTLDGRVAHLLFATPVGWACLVGGVALDAVGAWWMARLTGAVA